MEFLSNPDRLFIDLTDGSISPAFQYQLEPDVLLHLSSERELVGLELSRLDQRELVVEDLDDDQRPPLPEFEQTMTKIRALSAPSAARTLPAFGLFFGTASDTLFCTFANRERDPIHCRQILPGLDVYFDDEARPAGLEVLHLNRRPAISHPVLDQAPA